MATIVLRGGELVGSRYSLESTALSARQRRAEHLHSSADIAAALRQELDALAWDMVAQLSAGAQANDVGGEIPLDMGGGAG